MKVYTTVTGIDYYESLREDAANGGETNWTINRQARSGDRVLLYVCAPVSAIVAVASVVDPPYPDEDVQSIWFGRFFADLADLRMLEEPIQRATLLARLPDFKYWKQPRNSIAVPPEFLPVLGELAGIVW